MRRSSFMRQTSPTYRFWLDRTGTGSEKYNEAATKLSQKIERIKSMDCDSHLYSYRFHDYSVLHYAAFGSWNQPFIAAEIPRGSEGYHSTMMTMINNKLNLIN